MEEEQRALNEGSIDFIGTCHAFQGSCTDTERTRICQKQAATGMGNPISADLQPFAVNTKGSGRSYPQRRETVSRVESKSQRSNQR